ncbi:MAG: DegV family EDD domain-containing protein [Lachnospiraceae bacterium]|nr:DegV family EDD domain-containing protein [Lachnospiraceae bacterium]
MFKKLKNMIADRTLEVNERIFRIIILLGTIAAIAGIVESIVLVDIHGILIPLVIMLGVMITAMIATFKYRLLHFSSIVLGLFIIVVVFPEMFIYSGGLGGGASVWFSLGLFYVFLMFSGKELVFFVGLSVVADTLTYWYTYSHPNVIVALADRQTEFTDSLFSVLAVGLVGGCICRFQIVMYNRERDLVQKQNEELERLSKTKNRFFANMSHEIRTPINSIIGWNEMILRQNPDDEIKEYAENVQSASDMLLNLINDILDMSQIEMQKMEIIPIQYQPRQLIEDLVSLIQIRVRAKKLTLNVDVDENLPTTLYGDEKRLKQIILNLLTNAVKYTEKGSITLTVSLDEDAGEGMAKLKFSVVDTGIGIRKEDLGSLYNAFQRIDAQKNIRVEGSGLGLAIAKQLLDMMDGEIAVDSIYTKGSVFTVTLEQKIIDSTPVGVVDFLAGNHQHKDSSYQQLFEAPEARVLIVDDNSMNGKIAANLLKYTRVQIDIVSSGAECLKKTKEKYYHVILMDYMMPGMNGAETLKALRKQENGLCKFSAVIVLTASSASEAEQIYEENGFDSYMEKPIVGKSLEEEVLRFLPGDIIEYSANMDSEDVEYKSDIQRMSQHKRKKIYITTDCVCDLPEEVLEQMDIKVMYLYIKTDTGRFMDTVEINSDNLSQYMKENGRFAKADSSSVSEYEDFFAEALTQADEVVHVSMAKNAGKSYHMAVSAAAGFDHVHVIDSGHISSGQGLLVMYAARLAIEGCGSAEICEKVDEMKNNIRTRIFMPTMREFAANGYTSALMGRIAETFHLRTILKMSQSRVSISRITVGDWNYCVKRFIHNHVRKRKKINKDIVFVTYVGCNVKEQEMIRQEIQKKVEFQQIVMRRSSFSCACNCGMGAVSVSYFRGVEDEKE